MNRYTAVGLTLLILNQPALAQPEKEPISLSPLSHLVTPPVVHQRARVTPRQLHDAAARSYPKTHFQKGQYFKQKGDVNNALIEFLKSTQEDPRLVKAFYEQALIFHERGYLKLAESSLEQALAVQPDYQQARLLLATVRLEQGKLQEAIGDLGRTLGLAENTEKAQSPPPAAEPPPPAAEPATLQNVATALTQQGQPEAPAAAPEQAAEAPQQQAPSAPSPDLQSTEKSEPLDDLLKGIPGIDPNAPENPPPDAAKPAASQEASPATQGPGAIITRTVPGAVDPASLFRQSKAKGASTHRFANPFGWFSQHHESKDRKPWSPPLPKTLAQNPKTGKPQKSGKSGRRKKQDKDKDLLGADATKQLLAQSAAAELLRQTGESPFHPPAAKQKKESRGWFSWLFRTEDSAQPPQPARAPRQKQPKDTPPPKSKPNKGPDIAEALKQQQEKLNEAISMVLRQPAATEENKPETQPVISLTMHDKKPLAPPVNQAPPEPVVVQRQALAREPAPQEKPASPAAPVPSPAAVVFAPQPVAPAPVPQAKPAAPRAQNKSPLVIVETVPVAPVQQAPPSRSLPLQTPPAPAPHPIAIAMAPAPVAPPAPPPRRQAPVKSPSASKGPAFREPQINNGGLNWLNAAQSNKQSNMHSNQTKAAAPAKAEDPWVVRMRYLVEHGTDSLKPGEAFMFSEETGEGVLFQANGQTIRRMIADPQDAEEVTRMRRPDIAMPQDLMYNLSLLGKLLPRQDEPPKAEGSGFNLDQLMPKGDGWWGWFKDRFKM